MKDFDFKALMMCYCLGTIVIMPDSCFARDSYYSHTRHHSFSNHRHIQATIAIRGMRLLNTMNIEVIDRVKITGAITTILCHLSLPFLTV